MLPISGPLNSALTAYVMQPATAVLTPFGDQQWQYASVALPSGDYEGTVAHVATSAAVSAQFFGASQTLPMSTSPVGYHQHYMNQPTYDQQANVQYWQCYTNNRAVCGDGPYADWTQPFHEHLGLLFPYQPPVQQRSIDCAKMAPAATRATSVRPARGWRRGVPHSSVDLVRMSTPDIIAFASTVAGVV
ncbi:hypothetical protein AAVH_37619 [Aphelenchoides avenae]|nr:hypothetical protein AAVH_37619 [Aphelenchus avenae]